MDNALGDTGSSHRTYMEVGSKLGHHGRTIPYICQFTAQNTHGSWFKAWAPWKEDGQCLTDASSSCRTHMEVG